MNLNDNIAIEIDKKLIYPYNNIFSFDAHKALITKYTHFITVIERSIKKIDGTK